MKLPMSMLWLSLLLSIASMFLQGDSEIPTELKRAGIIALLMGYGLWILLLIKIHDGKNWARMLLLVVLAVKTPLWLWGLPSYFMDSLFFSGLSVVISALDIAAVWLLFSKPAASHFQKATQDAAV